ncbi:collagenase, partial [Vibrio parahaemolyticus]|nr:collagenase [Vibrio parahaemolyticus]
MELKTLSVAIATTLTSTGVFALSEPVSQVTEQHAHSAHTRGVESNRVEYQPTATLPIQPSKATRVQSLESLDESSTACDLEALVTESSNQLISE